MTVSINSLNKTKSTVKIMTQLDAMFPVYNSQTSIPIGIIQKGGGSVNFAFSNDTAERDWYKVVYLSLNKVKLNDGTLYNNNNLLFAFEVFLSIVL